MFYQFTNFIYYIIFVFVVFSCSNKSKKKIIFSNDNVQKEKNKQINIELEDSINFKLEIFNRDSVNLDVTKLELDTNQYFIERFPHKKITKQIIIATEQRVQLLGINYKDSFDRKNAFFNFLDCFDKTCRSIKVFDKVNFKKSFLMLVVSEKSIHIIESENNLDVKKWINFVRFSEINSSLKLIVVQKKQQKAKWYNFLNHQLIEIL